MQRLRVGGRTAIWYSVPRNRAGDAPSAVDVMIRYAFILALLPVLGGCERNNPPPSKIAKHLDGYINPLPADLRSAKVLLVGHLSASVHRVGDLLVVQDKGAPGAAVQTYVLPAATNWAVGCGTSGIEVRFGGSGDVSVNLSMAPIEDADRCSALSLTVAQTLQAIAGRE
ncbi:MAG TPA: hypothetical protein VMU08_06235 [Rhizomicrobium sp.]|nr:hypothetical protein [Rhizomicrobium sp.]